ncbi:DoxX family protein [Halorhodospira halochloris]|uniref:DoxX family protein n=1 Tax=Halorhodospira halochloris TaxID=1052 RepID=UPI001EE96D9F|nr:DoxX family protein [Halorhodospira halochloris]MCG5531042.1 DoxX family protein [Halorhodospira halochloris]
MQVNAREILIGGYTPSSALVDASWVALRVVAGLFMAFGHGLDKVPPQEPFIGMVGDMGFPAPALFAWLAGLVEFFGGLLLAAGALTRVSAFSILVTMLAAGFIAHAGDPFAEKELALLFAAVMLPFIVAGAGRWSGDSFLRERY